MTIKAMDRSNMVRIVFMTKWVSTCSGVGYSNRIMLSLVRQVVGV